MTRVSSDYFVLPGSRGPSTPAAFARDDTKIRPKQKQYEQALCGIRPTSARQGSASTCPASSLPTRRRLRLLRRRRRGGRASLLGFPYR